MSTDDDSTGLGDREELRLIDEELGELHEELDELRQAIGGRSQGPGDPVDHSTLITALEADEALVAELEARRRQLVQRLGEA